MLKHSIAAASLAGTLMAAAAVAQTSAPTPTPSPAPATTAAPQQNLAGQGKWRASKLMGVDIYGPDDKKVGDVTEVLFDKAGKVEMVTVGVGGFLGIGSKDVAIPFDQVSWSDQPLAPPAPPSGGMSGSATPPALNTNSKPAMYPDHGKITMTKEQLSSAPAVTYSN